MREVDNGGRSAGAVPLAAGTALRAPCWPSPCSARGYFCGAIKDASFAEIVLKRPLQSDREARTGPLRPGYRDPATAPVVRRSADAHQAAVRGVHSSAQRAPAPSGQPAASGRQRQQLVQEPTLSREERGEGFLRQDRDRRVTVLIIVVVCLFVDITSSYHTIIWSVVLS